MENQHRLIKGYADLNQDSIDFVNKIKEKEADLAVLLKEAANRGADARDLALAKTYFENAFMRFVRAETKPDNPWS